MKRAALRMLTAGALAAAVLVSLSSAQGICPSGALSDEAVQVTTSFGSFEVRMCAVGGDAAEQETVYTFTVRNVDLSCPIQSFAIRPIAGVTAKLSPGAPWQAANEEPHWWIWDGAPWSAIPPGKSRVFELRVCGVPGTAAVSGAAFTGRETSCGANELVFAFPGQEGSTAAAASSTEPGPGTAGASRRLCECPSAANVSLPAAAGITVVPGCRAEYFIPPSPLNCASDVAVGTKGEIYVAVAGSRSILLVNPDGTTSVYARDVGAYAIDVDARGKLYGYNFPRGEVLAVSSGAARVVATLPPTAYESTLAAAPDGTLFVGFNDSEHGDSSGWSKLYRIPPSGGEAQVLRSGMSPIKAIDVDQKGNLYGVFQGAIWAINKDTGATTPVKYLPLEEPSHHGLAVGDDGSISISTGDFSQSGSIFRVSPGGMTGQVTRLASFEGNGIEGIALTSDGSVVGVQRSIGGLQLVRPDGTVTELVHPNGLVTPQSMAFSPCGELLIVCDEAGWVALACPDGQARPFVSMCSFRPPQTYIAFSANGWFVAGESAPGFPSELNRYATDGRHTTLAADLSWVSGVAVAPDETIYVAATGEDRIYKLLPDGRRQVLVDKVPRPQGLALGPDGVLYAIVLRGTGNSGGGTPPGQEMPQWGDAVVKIQPSGSAAPFANIPMAAGITVGPDGRLYVAAHTRVVRIDPTGTVSTFASGFAAAKGVAFDAAGSLYVSDEGQNMVVRISGTESAPTKSDGTTDKGRTD